MEIFFRLFIVVIGWSFSLVCFADTPLHKYSKQVCQQLEKVKFGDTKIVPTKFERDEFYTDLSVKKSSIHKTEQLSKKCLLINGTSPIVFGELGKFNQFTFYYQLCGRGKTELGIFTSVSDKEIEKTFATDQVSEVEDATVFTNYEIPEFAVHDGIPLLKISGTSGHAYFVQYYFFDSKYWYDLDMTYWKKVVDKALPSNRESRYFALIDLKTLVASLDIRVPSKEKEEWRFTGAYETLKVQLGFDKDKKQIFPLKLNCGPYQPYK